MFSRGGHMALCPVQQIASGPAKGPPFLPSPPGSSWSFLPGGVRVLPQAEQLAKESTLK